MILYLNCDDNLTTFNKKNYLLKAAKRLGITFVKDLKDREGDNDYCLNIEPCSFKTGNRWTGVWEIDLLCDRPNTGEGWDSCNQIFLAGSYFPSRLKKHIDKTTLLFQACDSYLHKRTTEAKYDFVHCGTSGGGVYEERSRLVELLRKKYTFCDFGKDKTPEQYVNIISTARIQFIRSMKSVIAEGEVAQRFFECLAIGPVITNYVSDLELLGLTEGRDYFSYKTDGELLEKFDHLIKYPEFATTMAKKGRKKALMCHTYEHRLLSILNLVNDFNNNTNKP